MEKAPAIDCRASWQSGATLGIRPSPPARAEHPLVARPTSWDLFICAKDLFIEAIAPLSQSIMARRITADRNQRPTTSITSIPPQQSNLSRHRTWGIAHSCPYALPRPFCRRDDCASTRRCATTGRASDNAAGEAGAGIAGRVALVVVHAFMNYDRGAIRVEERIRLAFLQRDRRIQYLDRQLAVLRDMEVRHVAGMTMTRQHAVLLIGGIEVRASRCERGRLAFGGGMDMERMPACRHSFERKLE